MSPDRPKVFITRRIAEEAIDRIATAAEVEVWPGELPPPPETILEKAAGADGLVTLLSDRIDAAVMAAAPRLKVVSNYAVGFDNIDVAEATRRGIVVGNTPDVLTGTTADFAFALLMAAARRVVEADGYTRRGQWRAWGPMVLLGQDVHGSTLGIVGLGRIGAEMARRARGFGMRVLYRDVVRLSPADEADLGVEYVADTDVLLAQSDFVSLHIPLRPETTHLIGPDHFARIISANRAICRPIAEFFYSFDPIIRVLVFSENRPSEQQGRNSRL